MFVILLFPGISKNSSSMFTVLVNKPFWILVLPFVAPHALRLMRSSCLSQGIVSVLKYATDVSSGLWMGSWVVCSRWAHGRLDAWGTRGTGSAAPLGSQSACHSYQDCGAGRGRRVKSQGEGLEYLQSPLKTKPPLFHLFLSSFTLPPSANFPLFPLSCSPHCLLAHSCALLLTFPCRDVELCANISWTSTTFCPSTLLTIECPINVSLFWLCSLSSLCPHFVS